MANPAGQKRASSQAQSRTIALVVAAVLLSGSVLGGFFWLQRRATRNSGFNRNGHMTIDQIDTNREATIARATELRDKWKDWALQHQQPLRAMLASSGENQDAFLAVRNLLPDIDRLRQPPTVGISRGDLGSPVVKISDGRWLPNPDRNVVWFGWRIDSRVPEEVVLRQFTSELERERFKRQQVGTLAFEKENFVKWHDIAISSGSNEGFNVSLWASGRVTEKKWYVGRDLDSKANQVNVADVSDREVLPPYNFLKQPN